MQFNKIVVLWGSLLVLLCLVYILAAKQLGVDGKNSDPLSSMYGTQSTIYLFCQNQLSFRDAYQRQLEQRIKSNDSSKRSLEDCGDGKTCSSPVERKSAELLLKDLNQEIDRDKASLAKYPYEMEPGSTNILGMIILVLIASYTSISTHRRAKIIVNSYNFSALRKSFVLLFSVVSIGFLIRYSYTSILMQEKVWFTNESFCIRGPALTIFHLPILLGAFGLIILPLATMWASTSYKVSIPKIDLSHEDRECGLSRYFDFIAWRTVILTALLFGIMTVWTRRVDAGNPQYGVYAYTTLTVGAFFIAYYVRLFLNLRYISWSYTKLINKKGRALEKKNKFVPENPAYKYLGDRGFKFLSVVSALFGTPLGLLIYQTQIDEYLRKDLLFLISLI